MWGFFTSKDLPSMVRCVSNGDGIQLNTNIKKLGVTEQSEQMLPSGLPYENLTYTSSHSNVSGDATLLHGDHLRNLLMMYSNLKEGALGNPDMLYDITQQNSLD
jgi:hypothetical protein